MTTLHDPRRLESLCRVHAIEIIMTLIGRSAANPREFRRWLETLSDADLQQHYAIIMEGPVKCE